MQILKGKGVYATINIGKIYYYSKTNGEVTRRTELDSQKELERFENAKELAKKQLTALYEKALNEVGQVNAQIFEIHQMMVDDEDFCDAIKSAIESQKVNAEYAVQKTGEDFSEMFATMDDPYMKARANDVLDISSRLTACLLGNNHSDLVLTEPVILVADDLTPSETVQLDKSKILGFATSKGSDNSHTSILARTMGIPAVVNIGLMSEECDGKLAVLDGVEGLFIIDPDEATIKRYNNIIKKRQEKVKLQQTLKGLDNVTLDGKRIDVYANIGGKNDIGYVLSNDAGGIGLFRSEFLYLKQDRFPTEEEQFEAYREVLESMRGKKVVVRTMDIGADKKIDYFNLPEEENPALGYRAIRICLTRQDIFRTQLRALLRASASGKMAIMFPMIISVKEVLEIKEIVESVKEELRQEKVPFDENIELGIMIETPAAAIMSDDLAQVVDFFSVGTNDLTQYTLALDRQNQNLARFHDAHHPAVLRLIKMATDNAHKYGKWIGICGELGADPELSEFFIRIGVDELSVSPSKILGLREKIRNLDISKSQKDTHLWE